MESLIPAGRRVALAYSGGLSSTLLALIARKRYELECFVAGTAASPDVLAAKAASGHFEYRLEVVDVNAEKSRRIARDLRTSHASLSTEDIHALVPLQAVLEKTGDRVLLTGVGFRRPAGRLANVLQSWSAKSPFLDLPSGRSPSRAILRRAVTTLGLPAQWAAIVHRAPAAGAGIERFLRTNR